MVHIQTGHVLELSSNVNSFAEDNRAKQGNKCFAIKRFSASMSIHSNKTAIDYMVSR